MSFNYTCLPGVKLTATEKQLLEEIDSFSYPLTGHANLAVLHSRITVELSDKQKIRKFSYEITPSQRDAEINSLQNKFDELSKLIDQKRQEFEETQGSERDKLGKKLGELDLERVCLRDIYCVYKNAKQETNGNYIVSGDYDILGEYVPVQRKVILYYETIKNHEPFDLKRRNNLLAAVYVHEMMHAYLDCGSVKAYFDKIEEPIVEYAMLSFFNAFDKNILQYSEKHVEAKQKSLGMAHYGFGYCIFKNPNGINWLEDYRNAKISLVETDPNVAAYLDYWKTGIYPEKKEKECLVALYKALHHGTTIPITVKQKNIRRVRRRNYTINGKGSYSMYEVVEEFVKFLQGQGYTIGTINQEIQNYINSGWIFVSSNPGKVAWSNEKGEYSSLSGFYITKQWKGNANGNFTRLKDIINQQYNSFQIVEI